MRRFFLLLVVLALAGCANSYSVSTSQIGLVATRGVDEVVHISLPGYFKFEGEVPGEKFGIDRTAHLFLGQKNIFMFFRYEAEPFQTALPGVHNLGDFTYRISYKSDILPKLNSNYKACEFLKIIPNSYFVTRVAFVSYYDSVFCFLYGEEFGPGAAFAYFPQSPNNLTPGQNAALDQFYARSEKIFSGVSVN